MLSHHLPDDVTVLKSSNTWKEENLLEKAVFLCVTLWEYQCEPNSQWVHTLLKRLRRIQSLQFEYA